MEIAVKHLCKSFGDRTVLRDLTFTAGPGITAVMAPSGSGKTTLLRILLGLERPDGGTVKGSSSSSASKGASSALARASRRFMPPENSRTGCAPVSGRPSRSSRARAAFGSYSRPSTNRRFPSAERCSSSRSS